MPVLLPAAGTLSMSIIVFKNIFFYWGGGCAHPQTPPPHPTTSLLQLTLTLTLTLNTHYNPDPDPNPNPNPPAADWRPRGLPGVYPKNRDFRPISHFISEAIQDVTIDTMEGTASDLSNVATTFNELE